MINNLKEINKNLIDKYSLVGNTHLLKKQLLIKTILQEPDCFFKMQMNDVLTILADLGFLEQESIEIYKQLILIKK